MIRTVPINIKARFVSFKIRKHTPRAYDGRYGKTLRGRGGKAAEGPGRKSSHEADVEKQLRGRGGKPVTKPVRSAIFGKTVRAIDFFFQA